MILSAVFTAALKKGIIVLHPGKGVSAPTRARKVRQIVTPEESGDFYAELGDERWQLLVETDVETGLRWGELTELRPKDFNFRTRRITVARVAEEQMRRFHPEGGRFLVRDYPKDKEHRQVPVSRQLCRKIQNYIDRSGIGDDDLLFAMPSEDERRAPHQALRAVPVTVTDRLTAAASPIAAFAGLMIGFLVLKKVRRRNTSSPSTRIQTMARPVLVGSTVTDERAGEANAKCAGLDQRLLADAARIMLDATANGQPAGTGRPAPRAWPPLL